MVDNLVIVESPAKAKTIEKFLGKDFLVKSSFGHIRDLAKKEFGIDIENQYTPNYIISADKKKIVSELKKLAKEAKVVWLASDEDREGEAIAWHLSEVLELTKEKTRRIVFHEITKEAITRAVESPRSIDINLVNAQQARRILDRLVGFELSPVLWKKVKPSLSAGRVQSVAVRLLVEREREIINFKPVPTYRVSAIFDIPGEKTQLKAQLNKTFSKKEDAEKFLANCQQANYSVSNIETKPSKKSPSPPFTTSTLQQEASRKFGFSVAQTMTLAQHLYEAGKITYMRTDSVNLSQLAINTAKIEIESEYGEKYSKVRQYKTKAKGAQEAHEAIRPTYLNKNQVQGNANEKKLYELIWKRTIASQMSDAQLEKTQINIAISNREELFAATGEVLIFDGFLKVYMESTDDEKEGNGNGSGLLPKVAIGQALDNKSIEAIQKYSQYPSRYTEASLVKKLEEMGIGRPSTFAPTISTIQARDYVVKEDRPGFIRELNSLVLSEGKIVESVQKENVRFEKSKLFPTDMGMVVNDFLMEHFSNIIDFNFTADVESQFDDIANGEMVWHEMIETFYKPFHEQVDTTTKNSSRSSGERNLGNHPESGEPIFVKIGRYGPMAQIGESGDDKPKPRFARLRKEHFLETITLEEALELFKLPRNLGEYEDKVLTVGVGRFGPYVRHDSKFYSLKKGVDDPLEITTDRAIELILEKREAEKKKIIATFEGEGDLRVLKGRYGPYISFEKKNFRIPKDTDPETLTQEACMEIIKKAPKKKK